MCLLVMFIHGIYEYNIMIQSDSFTALNQLFLTAADDQNGKTELTPVSVDIQQRQNKELIGYLRDRAIKKKLIAECVFRRCCLSYKGMKGILSDGLADFDEHNTRKTLC